MYQIKNYLLLIRNSKNNLYSVWCSFLKKEETFLVLYELIWTDKMQF